MSVAAARIDHAPPSPITATRPFRIAVFSYGLPCPGEKRGGIEQVAHDLSNALTRRGHAVTVFTYDPRPATARYETRALPCRSFVMSWLGRRLSMGYLGNLLALGPSYAEFDVVIAHGDSLLLPLKGKPIVRVMHGTALEEAAAATSIGRALMQSGVYVLELLTAATQRGTVGISANTRRFNPFVRRVIPDGIDVDVFRPDSSKRSARPSLLFVGALSGRKRGEWLLDRFEHDIRPEFPNTELHMVTTPGRPVEGVTYHTGLTTEALVRLYQYAWLYVSPSTYEGFGLPYVEALACGTPVVATPNPGSREVLANGQFGSLVEDGGFAAEIARLLRDPDERERMARSGRARAGEFSIARSAALYESLIEELVD